MLKQKEKSLIFQSFKFIMHWRDLPTYELLSYALMFASVPMLAYGIQSYKYEIIRITFLTIITLYAGFFAALIWNDITDSDIDVVAHPNRPLPSGKINAKKFFRIALIFSAVTFCSAFLISFWCFILVGIAALFVAFHNKYFKRKVKFPAYSEIFSPLQWTIVVLFGFLAVWTAFPQHSDISFGSPLFGVISTNYNAFQQMVLLFLFMYFADGAHDIAEGIHDYQADKEHGVRTYATSFGVERVKIIPLLYCCISGLFGFFLFIHTFLSPVFLCFFLLVFSYSLYYCWQLYKSEKDLLNKNGMFVGRKLYNYVLFSFDILFLDILLQIIYFNFFR